MAALLVAWWAYSPGLAGGFLFDDFNNLNQIGAYGRVDNLKSLVLYATSGSADPTGRPLSLLSFLLDARDWPADPAPFKRTNILLHLLNGLLLIQVLLQLGARLRLQAAQARAAALLGGCLWILHPFLVSTTLYVVQREAMLPASFTLIGMLCWIEGSARLTTGRKGGLILLLTGAWACTALATLCKANGILLPLLLLLVDWILPAAPGQYATTSPGLGRARFVLLGLPSIAFAAWLAGKVPDVLSTQNAYLRPWTTGQRLLSEPRALADYLGLLWIPRASGSSVFTDDFPVSSGWFQPWTTLPCLLLMTLLVAAALKLRRSHPALALAVLFYFTGHLLESSLIPLELYFEHRNYVPALLMFWPLALWITGEGSLRRVRLLLALGLPALLALLCHLRADTWGKPYEQALLLAQAAPDSPRAQATAASFEINHHRPDLAVQRLEAANRRMPDEVQIALNWVDASCAVDGVSPAARAAAAQALSHDPAGAAAVWSWLAKAVSVAAQGACRGLDLAVVETLLQAARRNPSYMSGDEGPVQIEQLQGRIDLARGDAAGALQDFNRALARFPIPDTALLQAALLGEAGWPQLGLDHLAFLKTLKPADRGGRSMAAVHLWLLDRYGYWDSELDHMTHQLEIDAQYPAAAAKRDE